MRGLFLLGSLLLLVFLLWPIVRRLLPPPARRPRAIQDELVKDPVCQTYVLRSRAVRREAGGTTHYFCSRECAARFSG
ncbi:MAG: TRASH domain protein [candidate division NC10 bacterium]|jgi:YHS domain-containing protein